MPLYDLNQEAQRSWLRSIGRSEEEVDLILRGQQQEQQRRELGQYQRRATTMQRNIKDRYDIDVPAEPPVEGTEHSLWDVFDVFFALEYPIFNAAKHIADGDDVGEVLKAAGKGLILQEKTSGDDVLASFGMADGKGRSIAGFLMEMGLNPANLLSGPLGLTKLGQLGKMKAAGSFADKIDDGSRLARKLMKAVPGATSVDDAIAKLKPLEGNWAEQVRAGQRELLGLRAGGLHQTLIKAPSVVGAIGAAEAKVMAFGPVKSFTTLFGYVTDEVARQMLHHGEWEITSGNMRGLATGNRINNALMATGNPDVARVLNRMIEDPVYALYVNLMMVASEKTPDGVRKFQQDIFRTQAKKFISKGEIKAGKVAYAAKNSQEGRVELKKYLVKTLRSGYSEDDAVRLIDILEANEPAIFANTSKNNVFLRKLLVENRDEILSPGFLDEYFNIVDPSDAHRGLIRADIARGAVDKAQHATTFAVTGTASTQARFDEVLEEIYTHKGVGPFGKLVDTSLSAVKRGEAPMLTKPALFAEGMDMFVRRPELLLAESPEAFAFYQSFVSLSHGGKIPAKYAFNSQLVRNAAAVHEAQQLDAMLGEFIAVPNNATQLGAAGNKAMKLLEQKLQGHRTSGVWKGPLAQIHALATGNFDALPVGWFNLDSAGNRISLKSMGPVRSLYGRVDKIISDLSMSFGLTDTYAIRRLHDEGIFGDEILTYMFGPGWKDPKFGITRAEVPVFGPVVLQDSGAVKKEVKAVGQKIQYKTLPPDTPGSPLFQQPQSRLSEAHKAALASRFHALKDAVMPIISGSMEENGFENTIKGWVSAKAYRNAMLVLSMQGLSIPAKEGTRFVPKGTKITDILDELRKSGGLQIDEKVFKVAKEVEAELADMAEIEKSMGLLKSVLNYYAPHKLTKEWIKKLNKEVQVVSAKRGMLGEAKHRAHTGPMDALEAERISKVIEHIGAKTVTPDDLGIMYQIDPKLYMQMRASAHFRATSYWRMADEVTKRFGQKLSKDATTLPEKLAKTHTIFRYPPLGTFAVPKDIGQHLNGYLTLLTNQEEVKGLTAAWKQLVSYWRGNALGIFPAYHARNMVNNLVQMYLSGMSPQDIVRFNVRASHAIKYGSNLADEFMETDRGKTSYKALYEEFAGMSGFGTGFVGAEFPGTAETSLEQYTKKLAMQQKAKSHGKVIDFFVDPIKNAVMEGKTALAGIEPMKGTKRIRTNIPGATWKTAENKANTLGFAVGKAFEDNSRFALYLYHRSKGKTAEEARELVAKYLFDYNDISPFTEKLRDIMPFVVWSRKNIPHQLENLVMRPHRIMPFVKAKDLAEDLTAPERPDFPELPEFIRNNVPIAVRRMPDNTYQYFLLGNWIGLGDVQKLFSPFNETVNMLFPGIRIPFEMMANYSFYYRSPLSRGYPNEKKRFLGMQIDPMQAHMLQSLRIFSETNRLFGLGDSVQQNAMMRMMQFMSGARVYTVDPEQEMLRRYSEYTTKLGKLESYERHKQRK